MAASLPSSDVSNLLVTAALVVEAGTRLAAASRNCPEANLFRAAAADMQACVPAAQQLVRDLREFEGDV